MFDTPIYFEGEAGGGGGAAPAAPAAPAPAAPASAPGAPAAPTAPAAPAAGAPAGPDYGAKITEWGGEEAVTDAIALRNALATPEGVKALFMEAGRAQGLGDEKLEALFAKEVATGGDPIEALLSDPERQLTAKEVVQLMEAREKALTEKLTAQSASTNHAAAITTAVSSSLADLKVSDADRDVVLALADREMAVPTEKATPEQVRAAIVKGHAAFEKLIEDAADKRIKAKHDQRQQLPKALSGGTTAGGEALPEPKDLKEAAARVRAMIAGES